LLEGLGSIYQPGEHIVEEPPRPKPPEPVYDEVLCNCYLAVKQQYPNLPRSAEVLANVSPTFGEVAVFDYDGVKHYAVVTGQGVGEFYIQETNYKKCQKGTRAVRFSDAALLGFYSIPTPPLPSSTTP